LRLVQVPLGHARATDIQLADRAQWQQLLAHIQHIGLGIRHRPANRNTALAQVGDFMGGGERSGLRRPIAIEQVPGLAVLEHAADHLRVEHIAADDQITQLREHRQQRIGVLVEQPGGHPQHADGLLLQQRGKRGLGQQHCLFDHHHAAAIEQRRPHVEGAGVERRVGSEGHAVLRVELGVAVIEHQARDRAVWYLHALGRTRGTGGVEDVRHAVGGKYQVEVARGQRVQIQLGQGVEHPLRATVLHDKRLAFQRRIHVQGHVHGATLEDRQLADQQIEGARQRNRHAFPRLHALVDQVMGQTVGAAIEIAIAQG